MQKAVRQAAKAASFRDAGEDLRELARPTGEEFWLRGGGEAAPQARAAHRGEDERAERYWARPRPHPRAAGGGRLRRPAAAPQ